MPSTIVIRRNCHKFVKKSLLINNEAWKVFQLHWLCKVWQMTKTFWLHSEASQAKVDNQSQYSLVFNAVLWLPICHCTIRNWDQINILDKSHLSYFVQPIRLKYIWAFFVNNVAFFSNMRPYLLILNDALSTCWFVLIFPRSQHKRAFYFIQKVTFKVKTPNNLNKR